MLSSRFVEGRCYFDPETLGTVLKVLAGSEPASDIRDWGAIRAWCGIRGPPGLGDGRRKPVMIDRAKLDLAFDPELLGHLLRLVGPTPTL